MINELIKLYMNGFYGVDHSTAVLFVLIAGLSIIAAIISIIGYIFSWWDGKISGITVAHALFAIFNPPAILLIDGLVIIICMFILTCMSLGKLRDKISNDKVVRKFRKEQSLIEKKKREVQLEQDYKEVLEMIYR